MLQNGFRTFLGFGKQCFLWILGLPNCWLKSSRCWKIAWWDWLIQPIHIFQFDWYIFQLGSNNQLHSGKLIMKNGSGWKMCAPIGKNGGYSWNNRYSLAYQMDRYAWQLPSATHLNSQEERDPRNLLASLQGGPEGQGPTKIPPGKFGQNRRAFSTVFRSQ